MAFNYSRIAEVEGTCDKCKKEASWERPLVRFWTTGRHYEERNFIDLHLDCLRKIINAVELPQREETPQA